MATIPTNAYPNSYNQSIYGKIMIQKIIPHRLTNLQASRLYYVNYGLVSG